MQRAIYVSAAVGSAGRSVLSIAQILGASDVNNRRDHLTGVLLYHRGQFLQVIEGARVDLDRLIRRLCADARHTNLRFLWNAPAPRRFGTWPMAQASVTGAVAERLGDRDFDSLSLQEAEDLLDLALGEIGQAA